MATLMRTALCLAIGPLLAGALPSRGLAYNILALDTGGYWDNLSDQQIDVHAGMGVPGLPGERWFTMVDPADLAATNLMSYDVFLVQSGFTDDFVTVPATQALAALAAKAADIQSFVSAGRGVVAWSEPFPNGADWNWDWSPLDLTSRGVFNQNKVEITDPAHPVMSGLTDGLLSDWNSSWHGYFESWDPRLTLLARTGDYGPGDEKTYRPLTLAGAYGVGGDGRMVFTMQDPDFHAYQGFDGARRLIENSLDWAAYQTAVPVPEPASGWLLAAGGAIGLVIRSKTKRRERAARRNRESREWEPGASERPEARPAHSR